LARFSRGDIVQDRSVMTSLGRRGRILTSVAALILGAEGVSGQAGPADSLRSPTLRQLRADVASGNAGARIAAFWSSVQTLGTPLEEPGSRQDSQLVTFVFRGGDDIDRVRLDAGFNSVLVRSVRDEDAAIGQLSRLEGTDVWYLSIELSGDLRAPYRFLVTRKNAQQAERALDPLNRRSLAPGTQWARSLVALPQAPPQPWRTLQSRGEWKELTVDSTALGGSRPVYVYLPPGYSAGRTEPYAVLLGMDSYGFRAPLLPGDQILDYLAIERRIPETVMILTEDVGPIGDTRGYDPVVTFLADEVLPAVRRTIRISGNPADIAVTGMSRRGLVASYAAFKRPDAIGKVLSLSGSYYWRPPGSEPFEWLPNLYAVTERRPIRLYLSAGKLETFVSDTNAGHYLLGTNRHMRDVLAARGYDFMYAEFMGVHSEVNWEDQLAAGLTWLWSRR
jgi:enterochelin esterase family protein